jgi:glycosyltransferase involved in cell wall biosynthesis
MGTTENKNIEKLAEAIECRLVIIRSSTNTHVPRSSNTLFTPKIVLPIVEANAVDHPVVTSDLMSMSEATGDAACLVDPFNVASIRDGIRRVIEDANYREQMVARGFTNTKRFWVEVIAAQYAELYREIYHKVRHES